MKRLRIAFIKDWHDSLEHIGGNQDGILAAITVLSLRHNVALVCRSLEGRNMEFDKNGIHYITVDRGSAFEPDEDHTPDVIVCWGSLDRPWHEELPADIPALLCFAGGPTDHPFLAKFAHVFVESRVYEADFRSRGISVSRAFGTNADVFRPEPRTPKIFDAIYPASFCFHKNQELFARALGSRGLCVGQQNEPDIVGKCLSLGTPVLGQVSSRALNDLINMAHCVVIPSGPNGGSQRTVLEAMAANVPVIVADDNDKCREFVEESGCGLTTPAIPESIREAVEYAKVCKTFPSGRNYVLSKWTAEHYADALEAGLQKVL